MLFIKPLTSIVALITAAAACNGPRAAGDHGLCVGGDEMSCIQNGQRLCQIECSLTPDPTCTAMCLPRYNVQCTGACMAINNCGDCLEHIKIMSGFDDDEAALPACQEPGDNYYCDCD